MGAENFKKVKFKLFIPVYYYLVANEHKVACVGVAARVSGKVRITLHHCAALTIYELR
jgi:hypothetical protein